MKNKTRRTISIIVFVLALCVYLLTCSHIAILLPGISHILEPDVRITLGMIVVMIVSMFHFLKAIFPKTGAILWYFLPGLLIPISHLLIANMAFRKTIDESGVVIVRSAIVYDRTIVSRGGAGSLHIYFYRDGEKITSNQRVSRERFRQVNVGDTILIIQTVNDWQGIRIFNLNPTSEQKIKGLNGFEITLGRDG